MKSIDAEARDLITGMVTQGLAPYGLKKVDVSPDVDHDGDPVIRIRAHMTHVDPALTPSKMSELHVAIFYALQEIGDERFPSFLTVYPIDEADREDFYPNEKPKRRTAAR
jgi:hypothetical protein